MPTSFYQLAFTSAVKQEQQRHGSRTQYDRMERAVTHGNELGPEEQRFIALRDSLYMASVGETGWPYVQHRGGPAGFLHILDPSTLAFADFRGNKQYISLGNFAHSDRVALFFMDYPNQTRLKILGRVEIHEADAAAPRLIESLRSASYPAVIERAVLIHVEGFDWNCPQHITPRFTLEELEGTLAPLRSKLAALQAENAILKASRPK